MYGFLRGVGLEMKAELIARLIEAHCGGQEVQFERALSELVADEERKGKLSTARLLRNVYKVPSSLAGPVLPSTAETASISFVPNTPPSKLAPKDRESLLDLYETIFPNVTLDDVVLPVEQRDTLKQIIEENKQAAALWEHGLTPANRLLLCGPPGCGKTLTAMALTSELGLPMAYVRLDGLVSSFLGQTSTNLRKVFDSVRSSRVVLFLDEFDAIAKKRDDAQELGELKRVVTTLLQNLDNMPPNVFLIAATNHHHLLDPAIWRRFNLAIMIDLPDCQQRETLFRKWFSPYPLSVNVNLGFTAQLAEGLSCSQIKEIVSATAKHVFVSHPGTKISQDQIVDHLIRHSTLNAREQSEEFWTGLRLLQSKGVSYRALERALGIPKSTLRDRLKEGDFDD